MRAVASDWMTIGLETKPYVLVCNLSLTASRPLQWYLERFRSTYRYRESDAERGAWAGDVGPAPNWRRRLRSNPAGFIRPPALVWSPAIMADGW